MRLALVTLFGLWTTACSKSVSTIEVQGCVNCRRNSPGTQCQSPHTGVCWDVSPRTGLCPAGTTPCAGTIESGPACRDLGRGVIDQRCNEDNPICVYANGGQVVGGNTGQRCALCINSLQPNDVDQVAPDEGCDDVTRVCVGSRQLAADAAGTACAVCFNSIPSTIDPSDIDDGCPPTAPVCVNDEGISPALWTPGTACVAACFDTSLSGADEGVSDCVF